MSNVGATDVYLSNSRFVRNNDKPVDNNVFTLRWTTASSVAATSSTVADAG